MDTKICMNGWKSLPYHTYYTVRASANKIRILELLIQTPQLLILSTLKVGVSESAIRECRRLSRNQAYNIASWDTVYIAVIVLPIRRMVTENHVWHIIWKSDTWFWNVASDCLWVQWRKSCARCNISKSGLRHDILKSGTRHYFLWPCPYCRIQKNFIRNVASGLVSGGGQTIELSSWRSLCWCLWSDAMFWNHMSDPMFQNQAQHFKIFCQTQYIFCDHASDV